MSPYLAPDYNANGTVNPNILMPAVIAKAYTLDETFVLNIVTLLKLAKQFTKHVTADNYSYQTVASFLAEIKSILIMVEHTSEQHTGDLLCTTLFNPHWEPPPSLDRIVQTQAGGFLTANDNRTVAANNWQTQRTRFIKFNHILHDFLNKMLDWNEDAAPTKLHMIIENTMMYGGPAIGDMEGELLDMQAWRLVSYAGRSYSNKSIQHGTII